MFFVLALVAVSEAIPVIPDNFVAVFKLSA